MGIFITLTKKTTMFTVLYVIGKSIIMLIWIYITVLDFKGKLKFTLFSYIHVVEIPSNKRANSYKLKISKMRK